MNFLAHAYLAGDAPESLLGSIMGDFVKGSLLNRYPPALTAGLVLHRRIDSYTDAHPVVATSRNRVSQPRRRYAGILVDLFYDHCLAHNWDDYSDAPLEQFTERVYEVLLAQREALPERLQLIAPIMAQADWLGSYRHQTAIGEALDRMSLRLKRPNTLLGSAEELERRYGEFEADFRRFFPDVMRFAREARAEPDRVSDRS